MIRFARWTLALVFHNFGWKLLSLTVAVVLWALVANEPELATTAAAGLEFKNLPEDLEISSDPINSVVVEMRGPSRELRRLENGVRPSVVLDMSDVQPGERTFLIGSDNVKLARGVHLIRAMPSEVRFRFEKRATRAVPVQARFDGEGENGYAIARHDIVPRQLTIVGPASRVARVDSVVTDPVDVSAVVGTSEFRVNTFVDDPFVRIQSAPQVAVIVTMRKK